MAKLNQSDSFIGGTKKEFKSILDIFFSNAPKDIVNEQLEAVVIRGGLFWSERKGIIIPGKLNNGNHLTFSDFTDKLKQTLNH